MCVSFCAKRCNPTDLRQQRATAQDKGTTPAPQGNGGESQERGEGRDARFQFEMLLEALPSPSPFALGLSSRGLCGSAAVEDR